MAKKKKRSTAEIALIGALVWFAVDMTIVADVTRGAVKKLR